MLQHFMVFYLVKGFDREIVKFNLLAPKTQIPALNRGSMAKYSPTQQNKGKSSKHNNLRNNIMQHNNNTRVLVDVAAFHGILPG